MIVLASLNKVREGVGTVSRPVFADLLGHDPRLTLSGQSTFPDRASLETRIGGDNRLIRFD
jgi:hypothetical protein